MAWAVSSEPVLVHAAEIVPAGEAEVFDLTVESSAHYISLGGLIQANCWDEAPTFQEQSFRFVNAWNRTTDPNQRCRVVAAGNPPTRPEEEWVLKYWAPWLDSQHANPAEPGESRWFAVINGKDEEVESGAPFDHDGETIYPRSRTFIPARLEDNPELERTGYRSTLQGLPEPLRSQLLYGDMGAGRADDDWQLIPTQWVRQSMRAWQPTGGDGLRMDAAAVDCVFGGADRMALGKKYGDWIAPIQTWPGKEVPDGVVAITKLLPRLETLHMPVLVDVLATAGGAVVTAFKYAVPSLSVVPINFGEGSTWRDRTGRLEMRNLRAEAYYRLREALDPSLGAPVKLPDDPELLTEICATRWKVSGGRVQIEKKEEIKERIGRSPDRADVVAMLMLANKVRGAWVVPERKMETKRVEFVQIGRAHV